VNCTKLVPGVGGGVTGNSVRNIAAPWKAQWLNISRKILYYEYSYLIIIGLTNVDSVHSQAKILLARRFSVRETAPTDANGTAPHRSTDHRIHKTYNYVPFRIQVKFALGLMN
jgi:hypothetical protein